MRLKSASSVNQLLAKWCSDHVTYMHVIKWIHLLRNWTTLIRPSHAGFGQRSSSLQCRRLHRLHLITTRYFV